MALDTATGSGRMMDVARRAGVSQATVSNVLNHPERVREDTIERVRQAMEDLGFVPNSAARQLKAGRSTTIGLVLADIANPFFTELARTVMDGAERRGLTVLLGDSHQSVEREASYFDFFEEQRVQGILVAPVGPMTRRYDRLLQRGTPTVLLDRPTGRLRFPSVALDDVRGGAMAVEHLLAIGRRDIAFVGGPLDVHQVAERLRGAQQAAEAAGVSLRVIETADREFETGEAIGQRLLADDGPELPDGIFAVNDVLALGVMKVLLRAGVAIPDRVALVGYDDIAQARHSLLPLASVRQPSDQLGRRAVDLLLSRIRGASDPAEQILLDPTVVVRESAAPRTE